MKLVAAHPNSKRDVMTTKKYHLTTNTDHIDGSQGKDLFLAPRVKSGGHLKPTLTSADALDGRGGVDTIVAALSGGEIAPWLANIEKGIFSHGVGSQSEIDLAHAKQMYDLTIKGFELGETVTIDNATRISGIHVIHGDGNGNMNIDGIDTHAVKTENISFSNTNGRTIDFQNIKSGQFNALHVTVADSFYNFLSGDVSARSIVIDSAGKNGGILIFDADKSHHHVSDVTVTGETALTVDFGAENRGFNHLASFDSSANTGGVEAHLASSKLLSVTAGSGNDVFTIGGLGGSANELANVSMGEGDDFLTFGGVALDSATMHFDGGNGSDTAWIEGNPANLNTLFSNFEKLKVSDATGSYALDSNWTDFTLFSQDPSDITISGSGLTSVTGDDGVDAIIIDELGGSVASKATVELEGGNDYLNLESLALDTSTQHFDGGDDFDSFDVIGNVAVISSIFDNFESAYIRSANGTYDFAGSGISAVEFLSGAASAVTFNNIATGLELVLIQSQTATLSLNIENAVGNSNDAFTLLLEGNVSVGSGFGGVKAVGLSSLEIFSGQNSNIIYLDQIGASNDYATLKLSGNSHLTVNAVLGSSSYIDHVNVTNTAGIDMLGLLNGNSALSSAGVTIDGGDGGDTLVGGSGADVINSGGGNNEIHGSLGADQINLKLSSGLDVLVFDNKNQSAYNSGDSVLNFNTGDVIDISAIVTSITSAGDVSSMATGVAALSTTHSVAFFDTANDTLYIDVNHDGQITAAQDMEVELTGFSGLQSWNLLG